jgi:hypothetical protein
MNVSSIMVKTVAALFVVAALISTRYCSEVGDVSVDDTMRSLSQHVTPVWMS